MLLRKRLDHLKADILSKRRGEGKISVLRYPNYRLMKATNFAVEVHAGGTLSIRQSSAVLERLRRAKAHQDGYHNEEHECRLHFELWSS